MALHYTLQKQGAFSLLELYLENGQKIKAESGAMVAMHPNLAVEGSLDGGILGGIGRLMTGETLFLQQIIAKRGAGTVFLAPSALGEIYPLRLTPGCEYFIQKDGFLAAEESVSIATKVQNIMKGLFSGEGFFVIHASGHGDLFISSYGGIFEIDVAQMGEIVVDNQHLVAWEKQLEYSIEKASQGWVSSFTSGEGLVCRFRGKGKVLIQTRNPSGFGDFIAPFLKK